MLVLTIAFKLREAFELLVRVRPEQLTERGRPLASNVDVRSVAAAA